MNKFSTSNYAKVLFGFPISYLLSAIDCAHLARISFPRRRDGAKGFRNFGFRISDWEIGSRNSESGKRKAEIDAAPLTRGLGKHKPYPAQDDDRLAHQKTKNPFHQIGFQLLQVSLGGKFLVGQAHALPFKDQLLPVNEEGLGGLGISDLKVRISESLSPISYLLSPISEPTRYTLLAPSSPSLKL